MFLFYLLIAPTPALFLYVCVCVLSLCVQAHVCVRGRQVFESEALPPTQVGGVVEAPEPHLRWALATDADVCERSPKRLNFDELTELRDKQINKRRHHLNPRELRAPDGGSIVSSAKR